MLRKVFIAAALVTFSSAPLLAQGGQRGGTSEQQKACRNDVVKLCRGLEQAGDQELYQCLQSNRQKLSKRCRETLDSAR